MTTNAIKAPAWRFRVQRLGCLQEGELEIKPLTLLCGPNNTGKTWVMYGLYGFLDHLMPIMRLPGMEKEVETLAQQGTVSWNFGGWIQEHEKRLLDLIHRRMKGRLGEIFNADPKLFEHSRFDWIAEPGKLAASAIARPLEFQLVLGSEEKEALRLSKPAGESVLTMTLLARQLPDLERLLADVVVTHLVGQSERRRAFLMPAERNGLHLFFRELSSRRTALLHHLTKDKLDINKLLRDVISSRYAEPIAHYIDWLNELPTRRRSRSGHFHALAEDLKKLVGGRYEVDAEGNIHFTPRKLKRGDGETPPTLDLHMTSSTVKSLFGLWFYLEHQAQPGDVLMIDEPELNLHPSNQRALARLLARLVNAGLYVVASTHSDYLVREFNSLIMLSQSHPRRDELMRRFSYSVDELLKPEHVGAYLFDQRVVSAMEITPDEGIHATTFDDEIHALNETSDDIYYAYTEAQEAEGLVEGREVHQ